jgi:nucleotide-binding universal stress UspA family protein
MMSRILVGVDGSEHADKAFEFAVYLAMKTGAKLLILHVFEELGTIGYSINKEIERDNREMLQRYQGRAKKGLVHTSVDVIESRGTDAAEEILKMANKENIDAIVLGSRGVGETRESLLGSITYKVSHSADRPIIIVR